MIATMAMGVKGSRSKASDAVISVLIEKFKEMPSAVRSANLNIDGGVGLSVMRRKALPVVLLPLFEECGEAMQPIVDAVYSLQQTSLEFRVVVVTDMTSFKELRPYGWAISHVQAESSRMHASWLDYAHAELDRIVDAFGCSYVIETSERGISRRSWRVLLSIAQLGYDLPNTSEHVPLDESSVFLHGSWRGWIRQVPVGRSMHRVQVNGAEWCLEISHQPKSSMVSLQLGADRQGIQGRLPEGLSAQWNSVMLFPAVQGMRRVDECLEGVMAIFDGLSLADSGILELEDSLHPLFESVPSSVVRTNRIDESDVMEASRHALSSWSAGL